MSFPFEELPTEVASHILSYLDHVTLCRMSITSHAWRKLCGKQDLWMALAAEFVGLDYDSLLLSHDEQDWKTIFQSVRCGPTCLDNTRKLGRGLKIEEDCLSVTFSGPIGGDQVVFADIPFATVEEWKGELQRTPYHTFQVAKFSSSGVPIWHVPPKQDIAYYEITISENTNKPKRPQDLKRKWCVAIGLATNSFPYVNAQPGWRAQSYGYHSDDGCKFGYGRGQSTNYGPKFGIGDTVGCGLNFKKREIFFTFNGKPLEIAFTNIPFLELYPVVGIDSREIISFNFGQIPFLYDFSIPPAAGKEIPAVGKEIDEISSDSDDYSGDTSSFDQEGESSNDLMNEEESSDDCEFQ